MKAPSPLKVKASEFLVRIWCGSCDEEIVVPLLEGTEVHKITDDICFIHDKMFHCSKCGSACMKEIFYNDGKKDKSDEPVGH